MPDPASSSPNGPGLSRRQLLFCLLPALTLSLFYELHTWWVAGTIGFPLDDSWIHAQFARNLATGHGFTFTGDRVVAGSTAPAWTLLLAGTYFVTRSVLIAGKVLGLVLQLGTGLLAARLLLALVGNRALAALACVVVSTTPAVVWGAVSGMEVGLASVLVLGGYVLYLTRSERRARQVAGLILLALACLARPEALVLLGVVAAHFVARATSVGTFVRSTVLVLAVAAVVLGPAVVFDYATTGRPLPTTFYAKSGPGVFSVIPSGNGELARRLFLTHAPNAVTNFCATLFDQYGPAAGLVVLLGVGAAVVPSLRRRGAALIVFSVLATTVAMGLVMPMRLKPENFRYTAHLVCLAAVVGIAALSLLGRLLARRPVRVAIALAFAGAVCVQSVRGADTYARSVNNIEQLHVKLAVWVRDHLPAGTTIAANDIGALAYFGGHQVFDLEGLVSPEALRYPRSCRGVEFCRETKADYVVIFPGWHPDIPARPDLFAEVHRVAIATNYAAGGDTLVVYRTPWTRLRPLLRPSPSPGGHRWPA